MRGCSCRGTAGFAHVSCLAEQAKILVEEVEDNNLGLKAFNERFAQWYECSLCEQEHHGVVLCALGWACWKTYVARPEANACRKSAMNQLGLGLESASHHEDALTVYEAELSVRRRQGDSEGDILAVQGNLAITYESLGRVDEALRLKRDVYTGFLKLCGEEDAQTLITANNYAVSLVRLERSEEAKPLMRKMMPVARRVLGENHESTLRMRSIYAEALYRDDGATFDDLREAVTILEDLAGTARRVFGGAHPITNGIERELQESRAALRAYEDTAPGVSGIREAVEAMTAGDA